MPNQRNDIQWLLLVSIYCSDRLKLPGINFGQNFQPSLKLVQKGPAWQKQQVQGLVHCQYINDKENVILLLQVLPVDLAEEEKLLGGAPRVGRVQRRNFKLHFWYVFENFLCLPSYQCHETLFYCPLCSWSSFPFACIWTSSNKCRQGRKLKMENRSVLFRWASILHATII